MNRGYYTSKYKKYGQAKKPIFLALVEINFCPYKILIKLQKILLMNVKNVMICQKSYINQIK